MEHATGPDTVPPDIWSLALEVFGGSAGALAWLHAPEVSLAGESPLAVILRDPEAVRTLLCRIDYDLPP